MAIKAPSLAKRRGGWLAKREGQAFEHRIEIHCNYQGITFIRIPDGMRRIGKDLIIPIKSPFDCILGKGLNVVFLDLKTIDQNSFPASLIKEHQVLALKKLSIHQRAGYLIYFKKCDKYAFFAAKDLTLAKGTSLRPENGLELGCSLTVNLSLLF